MMSRRGYFNRNRQLPNSERKDDNKDGRRVGDGRYCVWCKDFIPRQARHKTASCKNCKRQMPVRPMNTNNPWTRCLDCDAFMHREFCFCQECGHSTELGDSYLRKKKAAAQQDEFKAKQQKIQAVACSSKALEYQAGFNANTETAEDRMLGSINLEELVKKFAEGAAAHLRNIKPNFGPAGINETKDVVAVSEGKENGESSEDENDVEEVVKKDPNILN